MTARDCLALLFAGLLAAWWGYAAGARHTSERYEAELAAIDAAHAKQERARAETVAAAEKSARERLAAETARGDRLAAELAAKTTELDAERASITRRLKDVAEKARRDCAGLSPEWVRLYNEALGLAGSGDSAGGKKSGSGNAADIADTTGPAGTGVQPDALTTPEDVLAHVRDYGGYCRKLEAGHRALVTLYTGDSP